MRRTTTRATTLHRQAQSGIGSAASFSFAAKHLDQAALCRLATCACLRNVAWYRVWY